MSDVKSVLFVCWVNVCRSLAAEVLLKREMKRLGVDGSQIDSAGISPVDQPSKPSWPMRWASFQRGVWLKPKQRLLRKKDLDRFDLVIAMDRDVLFSVNTIARHRPKNVWLLSDFHPKNSGVDVPDPMRRPVSVCNDVLDMLEAACKEIGLYIRFDRRTGIAMTTQASVIA